jgi:hypothetical protein
MTNATSDANLRELERRWRLTGSTDDEAAYLIERVRMGDLTGERLEVAACCGHAAARTATGRPDPLQTPFDPWLLGLLGHGPEVPVQVAILAARVALPTWEAIDPVRAQNGCFTTDPEFTHPPAFEVASIPRRALLLLGQHPSSLGAATDLATTAERVRFLGGFSPQGGYAASWAFETVLEALRVVTDPMAAKRAVDYALGIGLAYDHAGRRVDPYPLDPGARRLVPWLLDPESARSALCGHLIAWALTPTTSR